MRLSLCPFLAAVLLSVLAVPAHAQNTATTSAQPGGRPAAQRVIEATIADRPSAIYAFEKHSLRSADGKRHYRIEIAIPKATAPTAGFPVLYMLDGNAAMDTLTQTDLAQLSASPLAPVLVAIGYEVATRNDVVSRAYDYTPPVGSNGQPDPQPVVRGRVGGGADIFMQLIQEQIKPLVRKRAAIDPKREYLWGHSYGGLFALHVLFTQPDAFARYIAGDPSAWWNDGALMSEWKAFDARRADGKRVAILVGTKPREPGRGHAPTAAATLQAAAPAQMNTPAAAFADMRESVQAIAHGLRAAGSNATYETFPESNHGDMLRVSLTRALQIAGQP
ncbi:MAG: alpha/beta hydrolase [Burkholderiaceae bacterium]